MIHRPMQDHEAITRDPSTTHFINTEQFLQILAGIVLLLDAKGNILFLNDNGHRLLEHAERDLTGMNWFDTCMCGRDREVLRQYFEHIVSRNMGTNGADLEHPTSALVSGLTTPVTHENTVLTKSGRLLIVLWRNHLLRHEDGTFKGVLCIGEDISAYRETEMSLQIALAKHRALFECFPIGVTVTDEEGRIIENNRTAVELLSAVREEVKDRQIVDHDWKILRSDGHFMSPEEYPSVRALKTKQPVHNVELGIINPDYSTTWLNVNAAPMDAEGYGLVMTYHNITEAKRLQDLLMAREHLRDFSASHTLDELIQHMLDEAERLTQSQKGFVYFLGEDGMLTFKSGSTNVCNQFTTLQKAEASHKFSPQDTWADCILNQKPVVDNHRSCQSENNKHPLIDSSCARELLIPVVMENQSIAVIALCNKPVDYTDGDIEVVEQLSGLVWDIILRKQAEIALAETNTKLQEALAREKQLANTDELTGVSNRRRILEIVSAELSVSRRYDQPMAVMLFDLDRFKWVNDTYGHAIGDQLLAHVARVVQDELRDCDAIGRLGGDEFILFMPMTTAAQAYQAAERIRAKVMAVLIQNDTGMVCTTISIGIVEYDPSQGKEMTAEKLFSLADEAMYNAKRKGRNMSSYSPF